MYKYRVTSVWKDGEVKTTTDYLGPAGKGIRQEVDEKMMRELSVLLMKPGLDIAELKRLAKRYEFKVDVASPKRVVLENDLIKKTLRLWIK